MSTAKGPCNATHAASPPPDGSGSGGGGHATFALNALTLQTIQDQQHIIDRQKELVATLKKRVEELEAAQRTQHQQPPQQSLANTSTRQYIYSSGKSYEVEVQLRRRVQAAETESDDLKAILAEQRDALATATSNFQAQTLTQRREVAAWKEKAESAGARAAAAAQRVEAMEQRTARLTEQLEKARREVEARLYEGVQWRSLALTMTQHLQGDAGRYAREQVNAVEDVVRRYSTRHAHPAGAAAKNDDMDDDDDAAMVEGRLLWSREAQSPLPSRFLAGINSHTTSGKSNSARAAAAAERQAPA